MDLESSTDSIFTIKVFANLTPEYATMEDIEFDPFWTSAKTLECQTDDKLRFTDNIIQQDHRGRTARDYGQVPVCFAQRLTRVFARTLERFNLLSATI